MKKIIFLLTLALFVNYSISVPSPATGWSVQNIMAPFPQDTTTRITIVGDTGTGERAYAPGFSAVQKAMQETMPDVLLHLGDFVYQPELFPDSCPIPCAFLLRAIMTCRQKNGNRKLRVAGIKSTLSIPVSILRANTRLEILKVPGWWATR